MPASRLKTLLFAVPVGLILGVGAIALEVSKHGLSTAVVAGLIGGVCLGVAIVVLVASRWNAPTPGSMRESRQAWERARPAALGFGLLAAGVAIVIGGIADGSGAIGAAAMAALGVVFLVGSAIVAVVAITRPELWAQS